MSSKRGRKRNDNLPPNRARDVQRAFRARRAAHLSALESRITELEDENARLRLALDLPPAVRAPLGSGPTGRGKLQVTDSLLFETMQSGHSHSPPGGAGGTRSESNSPSPSSTASFREGTYQGMNFADTNMMWEEQTPQSSSQQPPSGHRSSPRQGESSNSAGAGAPNDSVMYPLPPKASGSSSSAPHGQTQMNGFVPVSDLSPI